MTRLLILVTTISLLFISAQATLAASVSITPAGNGSFIIQGNNMDGVAGIDLTVTYDTAALAAPSVSQGSLSSGAAMVTNPSFSANSIRIAIVRVNPFSGSGQIATISFASHTGAGSITVSPSMINSKGVPVPGGGTASATDFQTPATRSVDTTSTSGSSMQTQLGTVSMPSDAQTDKGGTKPADTDSAPVPITEPAAVKPVDPPAELTPVAEPQKPGKVTMASSKGVLENFSAYSGKKSPAAFIALFNKEISSTIRQEPAAALSDGKTPLNILVKLESAGDKSPNFALNGATLVSLKKDDASSTWIIEALPQAGTVQAYLTILTDSDIIKYPLTLAPPIEGVSAVEADFAAFLTDSGAAPPKHDLNGDGKHDYLDDFIYTANYLMKKGVAGTTKK